MDAPLRARSYLAPVTPPAPRRPRREYTDADRLFLRRLLLEGGDWDEQYQVPPRPWSKENERFCEDVRQELEKEDWAAGYR